MIPIWYFSMKMIKWVNKAAVLREPRCAKLKESQLGIKLTLQKQARRSPSKFLVFCPFIIYIFSFFQVEFMAFLENYTSIRKGPRDFFHVNCSFQEVSDDEI